MANSSQNPPVAPIAGLENFSFAEKNQVAPVLDITPQADPVGFTLQEKAPHANGGGVQNSRGSKNKPLFRGKKVRNRGRK